MRSPVSPGGRLMASPVPVAFYGFQLAPDVKVVTIVLGFVTDWLPTPTPKRSPLLPIPKNAASGPC